MSRRGAAGLRRVVAQPAHWASIHNSPLPRCAVAPHHCLTGPDGPHAEGLSSFLAQGAPSMPESVTGPGSVQQLLACLHSGQYCTSPQQCAPCSWQGTVPAAAATSRGIASSSPRGSLLPLALSARHLAAARRLLGDTPGPVIVPAPPGSSSGGHAAPVPRGIIQSSTGSSWGTGGEGGGAGYGGHGGGGGAWGFRGSWRRGDVAAALAVASGALVLLQFLGDTKAEAKEGPKEPAPTAPPAPATAPSEVEGGGKQAKRKVVVLGSGWAAVSFLMGLDTAGYEVVVISPRNYFLFTPLLPGVTVGSVEARSVSEPIRRILAGRKKAAEYLEAECLDIDPASKKLRCREVPPSQVQPAELPPPREFEVSYDSLVVAVGAQVNTFNTPGVTEHCHFLKEVEDAEKIHRHVIECFEAAAMPFRTEEERKKILSFVIVGGGPTGVEFAAELHDMIKDDLSRLYPHLRGLSSITLIDAADHVLNMFDKRISEFAEKKFSRDGINVLFKKMVVKVTGSAVMLRDMQTKEVEALPHGGLVVWSTGIGTRPLVKDFMGKVGQTGRRVLATDEWLRVKGTRDVWALGDCATIEQRRMRDDISNLFKMADTNGDGTLDEDEFREVLKLVKDRYPQIVIYLQRKTFRELLKDLKVDDLTDGAVSDTDEADEFRMTPDRKVERISIKKFEEALAHVDSKLKFLPATAQVAAQQGDYLAACFNKASNPNFQPEGPVKIREQGRHKFLPFRYRHLGQFASFGTGQAGLQLPGDWVNVGRSTQWLWYSVYASKQVSWRTRALVVFDWSKRAVFGRDSSRI